MKRRFSMLLLPALLVLLTAAPGLVLGRFAAYAASRPVLYPAEPVSLGSAAPDSLYRRLQLTSQAEFVVQTELDPADTALLTSLTEQLARLQNSRTLPAFPLTGITPITLCRMAWSGSVSDEPAVFLLAEVRYDTCTVRAWLDRETGALCRLILWAHRGSLAVYDPGLRSEGFLDNLAAVYGEEFSDFLHVAGWYDPAEIRLHLIDMGDGAHFWLGASADPVYYEIFVSESPQ